MPAAAEQPDRAAAAETGVRQARPGPNGGPCLDPAGLGELVAYLEFEIMNHPGISEPDSVLQGVAELRARLA